MRFVNLAAFCHQESSEERNRQLKERLTRLFAVNERRVQRSVLYGADLLEACSVNKRLALSPLPSSEHSHWAWVGRDACLKAQQNSAYMTDSLRLALRSQTDRLREGNSLVKRLLGFFWFFCCCLFLFFNVMVHGNTVHHSSVFYFVLHLSCLSKIKSLLAGCRVFFLPV